MTITGDDVRVLRTRARLTQGQLATALKVTPQYVGMIERGEREINETLGQAIRSVFEHQDLDGRYVPDGRRYAEAKSAVVAALRRHPDLTLNGFRYRGYREDAFDSLKHEHESRFALLSDDSLAQVATALAWIDAVEITAKPKVGSYGAKHQAERWGRENGYASYVANGALLAAAVYRDVPLRRVKDTPNAMLGLDPDPAPKPKKGTFYAWLIEQQMRRGPIGDLAKDAAGDLTFPMNTSSRPKLRAHIRSHSACVPAIEALDEALREWRALRA
jgi:DNA-binding XRE family transcriptional regulator